GRRVEYIPRTEEMHAVRERASFLARHARERAERGVNQAMNEAAVRQAELEKTASNLESQFLLPSQGKVKLNVLGTNLYIRNYTTDPSSQLVHDEPLPVPLVAKAKRFKWLPVKPGSSGDVASLSGDGDDRGVRKNRAHKTSSKSAPAGANLSVPAE